QTTVGLVVIEVVVLNVERQLGAERQRHARVERELAERHQAKARLVRRGHVGGGDAPERGGGRQRDRLAGDRLAIDLGQRRAAAERQQQRERGQQRAQRRSIDHR